MPKHVRKVVEFVVVPAIIVAGLIVWVSGGHFSNRNRLEAARRLQCKVNLKDIGRLLRDEGLILAEPNLDKIRRVLEGSGLACPSARRFGDGHNAGYVVEIDSRGNVVVTERKGNHDTSQMRYVDLQNVRYELDDRWEVCEVVLQDQKGKGRHRR